jgi:hypothetical protein
VRVRAREVVAALSSRLPASLLLALSTALLLPAAPAAAGDPGLWRQTGRSTVPLVYFQGMTSDPDARLWFDGVFVGLYRTDGHLRERARREIALPPELTAASGYNHIGDPTWDAREGGRLLLPLECYTPGAPGGSNTCRRGAIGVADPRTLAWRYHVELDPAETAKAMWAEVSPDGTLLWTSAGRDLLAYRMSDVTRARAGAGAAPLRAVVRLAGAVPPSGISGAAFYGDRLFVSGRSNEGFEVHSIDLATGASRLEIQRRAEAEPEGLDVVDALGGVLHWIVRPVSGQANVLLHFTPVARPAAARLAVRPAAVTAGRRTRVRFRITSGGRPVAGAVVRLANRWVVTAGDGTARTTVRFRSPGRRRVTATREDVRAATAVLRVRER